MNKNKSLININQYTFTNIKINRNIEKGLLNTGHTCYINSIIQLLGHSDIFVNMVLNINSLQSESLLSELKEIIDLMWIQNHSIKPSKFLSILQKKFDFINIHDQQDLDEILLLIINKLNEELINPLNKLLVNNELESIKNNDNTNLINNNDNAWYNFHKIEYSEIIELFYGQMIIQVKCAECNKIHHSYDYFSILELEIPAVNNELPQLIQKLTLQNCIDSFYSPEYLNKDLEKEWSCDKCKTFAKNKKVIKICKLPPILFICLKRFKYVNNNNIKNNIDIEIPQFLDFDNYLVSKDIKTNTKYELIGSAIHLGDSNFGHYVTYFNNKLINDTQIVELDDENSNNYLEKSYILMYKTID